MTKSLKNKNQKLILYPTLLSNNNTPQSNSKEINNISNNYQKNKFSLQKSFSFNNITNPNNSKNNSKIIQILNSINITQYNNHYICNKNKIIDDETIKMKNRQINKEIKKINKILTDININNNKKDEEINKQGNLIDKILNINKQAYLDTLSNLEKNFKKDKNKHNNNNKSFNDLINKLYFQYQELITDNNEQNLEIKNLKKNIKNTKKNELIIENNILMKQYNKYKYLCLNMERKNENYKNKIRNKTDIENKILEKNFEILQLQENLKLSKNNNIQKEQEKLDLIKKIKEYQIKNKEIKNKINLLNQEYNYILLSKKNLEDNLFTAYNTTTALNNNLNEQSLSSNLNSNNVSNIITQNNINDKNSINTFEENVNVKGEIKNKIFDDDNNLNTVDEEKITNIESETNFKKDYIINEKNKINDIDNISNKNRKKYNESFIEKNSDLSDDNEN